MTDRPILFSGPMVRALLDGRKTQTRRLCKVRTPMGKWVAITSPDEELIELEPREFNKGFFNYASTGGLSGPWPLRFAKGDRLWVRETWQSLSQYDRATGRGADLRYAASFRPGPGFKWRVSIHMPRWASRLTLTVTDVRVQRLQEITAEDAQAEGATCRPNVTGFQSREPGWCMDWSQIGRPHRFAANGGALTAGDICLGSARDAFANYWMKLNGEESWNANPWIVALTFTVEKRNIDHEAESLSTLAVGAVAAASEPTRVAPPQSSSKDTP